MLKNAYFLAKFGFDTAENEPAKHLQNLQTIRKNLLISRSDSYVVFGEAKIEDLSAQAQQQAASQFQAAQASMGSGAAAAAAPPTIPEEDEGGDLDESGLEPKDVELVMSQASCSRSKAVKALRANDGDIVNAIMELTM